jgi:uncharacterized protein involved in type VI secretion and phage assembly
MFYGVYRGTVVANDDPQDRGRVRVVVPGAGVMQAPNIWISPAGLYGAGLNRGWFWPPEVGDSVWVSFSQGQARYPLSYWGGYFGEADNATEVPPELHPDSKHIPRIRGFVTRRGHRLILNETPGSDAVELIWHRPKADTDLAATPKRDGDTASLKLNKDGGASLTDRNGNTVVLDPSGKKITLKDQTGNTMVMSESGVTIDCGTRTFEVKAQTAKLTAKSVDVGEGATHPAAMGDNWLQWAATHTHGTGVGPTTTPISPPTNAQNSSSVKVRQ